MKIFVMTVLFSSFASAQLPGLDAIKDFSKKAFEACKNDKSKIKGCESYTEMGPLKTCLMANKEKLSSKCKTALKLVK